VIVTKDERELGSEQPVQAAQLHCLLDDVHEKSYLGHTRFLDWYAQDAIRVHSLIERHLIGNPLNEGK
jgi:hypothetical protein